MKVWKSPVFYFGILLVFAVAGLLAAPFVIDWNSYRADLEDYGRKITGRTVEINGDISVRLFPWPRLTAESVRISNPPGLDQPTFATADRIVVNMALAGLLRGGIDVEAIAIERPVIDLERLATGEGNWRFTPAEDLLTSDLLSRVSLDGITVTGGTLRFADRRRGETQQLDDFNAEISAPGLAGPWRLRSVSLYRQHSLEIGVTTGIWRANEPFRLGIRVAEADGSGLVFSFDGMAEGGLAEGGLRIEPAVTGDGKGDAEGQVRPLAFTSKVKASFGAVQLDEIEIAPLDPAQGGAITTGSASLALGRHISARVDLAAPMLDLDDLAGAQSRALVREAGSLALAGQLLDILPDDVSLSGGLSVTALKVGGETLDSVRVEVAANPHAIRISEFSAGLPGRSKALFSGTLLSSASGPELSGSLAVESNDFRQLTFWAWPDAKATIAPVWTGSRGRLKLQADVSANLSRFRLSKAQYEIDGEQGVVDLAVTSGGRQAIDLRIDGKRIDIDSFVPEGMPAFTGVAGRGIGGLWSILTPHKDAPDLRLTLQAGELLLNGVKASDVALDLASSVNGLDLRTLEIGSVGGARLEATGLVLDSGKGADGAIGLDIHAMDPRGLLRLLGVIRGAADPVWARELGETNLKGNLVVKPSDKGANLSFQLDGSVDELSVSGTAALSAAMDVSGDVTIESQSSERLVKLFGLLPLQQPAEVPKLPGRIDIKAAGTMADGFMTSASLQAFGARADYNGVFEPVSPGFGVDGRLSIRSTDTQPLIHAIGLPVAAVSDGVMVLDTTIKFEDGKYALSNIEGRFGASSIKGSIESDTALKINGHIETGRLGLQDILASTFLDWTGPMPDLEAGFRSAFPFGVAGELWIRPSVLAVHSHFEARDAEIGITADAGEIRLALFGKDKSGRNANIEIASLGQDERRRIEGRVSIPVDLEHQLLTAGGQPVAGGMGTVEVGFEAEGRSPGGALAVVRGSGSYGFDALRLLGLSPADFAATLAMAKDSAGITTALDALRGGDGLDLGKPKGTITITNGEVSFLPISLKTETADVTVRTAAELALGEIDTSITLGLKARPNLPVMTITYAGSPAALARNEDNTELSQMLGVTLMQEGVDELERLQAEQQRLAQQEERQRKEDEERLQAYYAQRDELLMRRREIKVHAELRVIEAERLRKQIEAERAANSEISKAEIKQRERELRVMRRLAKLEPVAAPQAPKPQRKTQPKKEAKPKERRAPRADPVGPLILEQPDGAPVIISPEPAAPPSQ